MIEDNPAGVGIGEAARRLGTTVRTLRYYEQRGLLRASAVSAGGHRRYDERALVRARQLLALRALGLPLPEVAGVLDAAAGGPGRDQALVRVLRVQQDRLVRQIAELEALRDKVSTVVADLGTSTVDAPGGDVTTVLEEIGMAVLIDNVYTCAGDDGRSSLPGAGRVGKDDPRFEALGDVDELVTALGVAVAAPGAVQVELLRAVQNDLFDLGADLADGACRVGDEYVLALEESCDEHNAALPPLRSFVVAGATVHSAALHHARSICRRAERHVWATGAPAAGRYLNRLSDLLFILARAAAPDTEPTWQPGAHRPAAAR